MDSRRKSMLVNRIIAGGYFVEFEKKTYFFDFRIKAQDKSYFDYIYEKNYNIALERGLITREQKLADSIKAGKWSELKEHKIEAGRKSLDEFKKEYFKNLYNNKTKGQIKVKYEDAKKETAKLLSEKHSLISDGTCESYCSEIINRCKYSRMLRLDGELLDEELFLGKSFVNAIEYLIYENSMKEDETRELARTNPWRFYWNLKSSSPADIFSIPVSDMSEEQQEICYWSSYYDSIYEAYERPSNDVIEDDLAIDGWYLIKVEDRQREIAKKALTEKAGDSKELFVITDAENAKKIYEMNDPHVRNAMKKRDKIIKEQMVASEQELIKKQGLQSAGLFIGQKGGRGKR